MDDHEAAIIARWLRHITRSAPVEGANERVELHYAIDALLDCREALAALEKMVEHDRHAAQQTRRELPKGFRKVMREWKAFMRKHPEFRYRDVFSAEL